MLLRTRLVVEAVIALCLLAIVFFEYARPNIVYFAYGDEFKTLSLACDQAMHSEVSIRELNNAQVQNGDSLRISSEIELAVCHEYDKLRKKMLVYGVSEDQLALLGLEALESEQVPVSRMIKPHQMSRL